MGTTVLPQRLRTAEIQSIIDEEGGKRRRRRRRKREKEEGVLRLTTSHSRDHSSKPRCRVRCSLQSVVHSSCSSSYGLARLVGRSEWWSVA